MRKRRTSVDRDYDYSMPLAGKKIVRRKEPETEPVTEVIAEAIVKKVKSQDWNMWKRRLFSGPLIFYIMFAVSMLAVWLMAP